MIHCAWVKDNMSRCQHLTDYIDQKIKDAQATTLSPNNGFRRHLGASIIGRACSRELWYSFRWATKSNFDGRVLRLFDRGHREEDIFTDILTSTGAEIKQIDPATNRQFGFKGVLDHFAGSMDGKAKRVPYQVEYLGCDFDDWILLEFKTHNDNSFKKLVMEDSVQIAKPEHHIQMVIYIDEHKLPGGLYGAVNKNTDELYFEFVLPDPALAERMRHRAATVISNPTPPPRISNTPTWWVCKFCDHRPTCHFGVEMHKSCRTCVNALPVEDGRWHCQRWGKLIPKDAEIVGCDYYEAIHD